MFNSTFLRNKQRRSVKVRSQKYINSQDEPRDNPDNDTPAKDETVLVENSPFMRIRFRNIAQRIRIITIHGIKKNARNIND